jgi:hypothetical protein
MGQPTRVSLPARLFQRRRVTVARCQELGRRRPALSLGEPGRVCILATACTWLHDAATAHVPWLWPCELPVLGWSGRTARQGLLVWGSGACQQGGQLNDTQLIRLDLVSKCVLGSGLVRLRPGSIAAWAVAVVAAGLGLENWHDWPAAGTRAHEDQQLHTHLLEHIRLTYQARAQHSTFRIALCQPSWCAGAA